MALACLRTLLVQGLPGAPLAPGQPGPPNWEQPCFTGAGGCSLQHGLAHPAQRLPESPARPFLASPEQMFFQSRKRQCFYSFFTSTGSLEQYAAVLAVPAVGSAQVVRY